MSKHAWLVRPFPDGNTKRLCEFKTNNFIAIGWPGIGDLKGKSREDIKNILSCKPYSYSGLVLGNAYATIDILVNRMQKGDYLLIPDGEDIYFAIVDSDYYFDNTLDNIPDGYPHQRKVKNFTTSHLRSELSKALRTSLKVHRTTADLTKHYNEIKALATGDKFNVSLDNVNISYNLRPDYIISFSVPSNITKTEAKRLSSFLETLFYKE